MGKTTLRKGGNVPFFTIGVPYGDKPVNTSISHFHTPSGQEG